VNSNQKLFLFINIIGGTLVLLSYIIGLKAGKNADVLWGGVPESARGLYTVSMLVSATSFFVFSIYIFLTMKNTSIQLPFSLDKSVFNYLYLVILISSTLWIPLVNVMVSSPSSLVWFTIRLILALVGLATLVILIILLKTSANKINPTFFYITLAGVFWFFVHTGILDAIVWPYLWKK
jgi:hypothetical protein